MQTAPQNRHENDARAPGAANPFDTPDPVQVQFATANEPLIALQSPPGSGKTESLARRFVQAVRDDTEPDRILVISFTNRARASFQERLRAREPALSPLIAPPEKRIYQPLQLPPLWIDTFHAVCCRILRLHSDRTFLPPEFSVETGDARYTRMRAALDAADRLPSGCREADRRAAALIRLMDTACAAGVMPDDSQDAGPPLSRSWNPYDRSRADLQVIRHYLHTQYADRVADAAIVPVALRALYLQHPDIADTWSRRWDQVLVDEYQDSSPVLTGLLAVWARHAPLAAVGDTDQNIFAFAHAIGGFGQLQQLTRKPSLTALALQHDYRLTRQTQQAVNSLRQHLAAPGITPLPATRQGPEPQAFHTTSAGLADLLRHHIRSDISEYADLEGKPTSFGDATILCRTHADCSALAAALASLGVPVWIAQSPDATRIATRCMAWLRIAADDRDHVHFASAMLAPDPAPPRQLLDDAERLSRSADIPPAAALARCAENLPERDAAREAARHTLDILHSLRGQMSDPAVPIAEAVRALYDRLGIDRMLEAAPIPVRAASSLALQRILRIAGSVDTLPHLIGLHQDLEHLGDDPPGNAVEIRTMHSAKGTQAPLIYAPNWEEGTYPRFCDNPRRLDDDRKLALVAISRASHRFRAYVVDDAAGPAAPEPAPLASWQRPASPC